MALYITVRDDKLNEREIIWHIGTSLGIQADTIVDVQADGDELDLILSSKFDGLPIVRNARVVEWYGDHAKFIVRNIAR